jgi:subtilisin family serine protease
MIKKSNTFYIVVAAGNENQDVKSSSPASAKGILTVMAMGRDDQRAYFSNFGRTASLYSTGVEVKSTIPGGKTAIYSGTSMACPAAVGVLNHYLDMYPRLNMRQLKEKMLSDATKDIIRGNPKNTPNLMVFLERN